MRGSVVLVLSLWGLCAWAQQAGEVHPNDPKATSPQQGAAAGRTGGERRITGGTAGTISEIKADSIKIKAVTGSDATIKLTDKTEFRKDQKPAKLADFKVGDTIFVRGEAAGENVWNAAFVISRSDMAAMSGGGMQLMLPPGMAENFGKTFVAGKVTAIEGTKITLDRPDQKSQTIEVDENTSFKKGQESVTLPDIKVGDIVMARGALKDGTFLATTVNTGGMQMRVKTDGAPPQP